MWWSDLDRPTPLTAEEERSAAVSALARRFNPAMAFSDRVVCMLEGRIVLDGEPRVLGKQAITEAYFGLAHGEVAYA